MSDELAALDPRPETVKLHSGIWVQIEDLKARQFFKLLRILTHGGLPILQDRSLFADSTAEEFGTRLLTAVLFAIPDAEDEALEFVRSLCKPVGLIEGRKLNKQDTERNNELWFKVISELDDPITIVEAVVKRESDYMLALGKRLQAMFTLAEKTGQVPTQTPPTSQTQASTTVTSSAGSPSRSTSSPASTDGLTNTSWTSGSPDSANVSQPSEPAVSTATGSAGNG